MYRRVVRRLSAYRSAHTLSSAARAHRAEVKEEKKTPKSVRQNETNIEENKHLTVAAPKK